MKKIFSIILSTVLSFNGLVAIGYANNEASVDRLSIDYPECDDIIIGNPGKGYERYGDANVATSDKVLEYASIGYWRFPWYMLEPKEGEYNWKPIDDFLEKWDERGGRCAFGVMAVASSSSNYSEYMTPKWVFDAGAKSINITYSSGRNQFIPASWSDPVFLAKISEFANALAQRYDGDRRIAYIDIRTCGNWGETHVMDMPGETPKISLEDIKNHIDAWGDCFKSTQLMLNTSNWPYEKEKIDYALSKGIGIRYDGVQTRPNTQFRLAVADGKEPTAWEFWNPYENIKKKDSRNFKGWNVERYLQQFLIGKPSYADLGQYNKDPDLFIADEEKLIKLMTNKMGYHFSLKAMDIPKSISSNEEFDITFLWKNSGVTKLYEACYPYIAILDEENNVVSRCLLDNSNPNSWESNTVTTESLKAKFESLSADSYKLAIGLFLDKEDEQPSYKIANFGMTEDKWYLLADLNRNSEDGRYYALAFPKVKVCDNYVDDVFYEANGERYINYEKVLKAFNLTPYTDPVKSGKIEFGYEADTILIDCLSGLVKLNGNELNISEPIYIAGGNYYISAKLFDLFGDLDVTFNEGNNCIMIDSHKDTIMKQTSPANVLLDGSFENSFDVWSYSNDAFTLSDKGASDGKYMLHHASGAKSGSASQLMKLEYDTYYKLSFDALGCANYSLIDKGANLLNSEIQIENGLSSDDWKTYQTTFALEKNVLRTDDCLVQLSFNAIEGSDASFSIDNVKIEKIGSLEEVKDPNQMFRDGGIESNLHRVLPMNELANFERSRNNPHSGDFCGRIYDRSEQWSGIVLQYSDEFLNAGPGKYKFEGWFRTSEGDSEITAYINYLNNFTMPGWIYTFNIGPEWTYISTEVEIDEESYKGIVASELFLLGDSKASNNSKDIYFDDISLTYIGR